MALFTFFALHPLLLTPRPLAGPHGTLCLFLFGPSLLTDPGPGLVSAPWPSRGMVGHFGMM